ncbi:hypothetical protein IKQ65_00185 [Candidatus Saccharibacteria bacterium]|nr:hypothetical protein [Candidatus Saccharibacteria bacterium]
MKKTCSILIYAYPFIICALLVLLIKMPTFVSNPIVMLGMISHWPAIMFLLAVSD